MCGLNGLYAYNTAANSPDREELIATRDAMSARGPDGAGEWWSEDKRLGLGHRRLSIIDLSDRAAQPMSSACGRYVVVFNGEIYNYPNLRLELEAAGHVFQSNSDTEVLIHLFARDGEAMVTRLRGMFAFAIWDDHRKSLFLARDPYGIKPLYTANDGWTFRFASQVKALIAGGKVSLDPEPAGIVGFHIWGFVPEPFTLYREIRSLPAGHTQWIDQAGPREPSAFASLPAVFSVERSAFAKGSDVVEEVRSAVSESVAAHLLADVEVGLFLSSGVDSGALLGLMRDAGKANVKAITLAFEEFSGTKEDEVPLAAQVARQFGAEHIVRTVSKEEYDRDLPLILEAMDQPSVDGVNTWFIAKAARELGLKVAISGIGGDEILAGYPSFQDVPLCVSLFRLPSLIPWFGVAARHAIFAMGIRSRSPKAMGIIEYGGTYPGAYMLRRGLFLPSELETLLGREIVEAGLHRLKLLDHIQNTALNPQPKSPTSRIASLESCIYLRNQLLRDADWAGMAHGIEIRTPLVDYKVLSSLGPLSRHMRGRGKKALALAPSQRLGDSILDRKKTGFGVPTSEWTAEASAVAAALDKGAGSRRWARLVYNHNVGNRL